MTLTAGTADFTRRDITLSGKTKPVLTIGGSGPAIIVMHEVYGIVPTFTRLCRWIAQAGFRVYAPVLFGAPDTGNSTKIEPSRIALLCISREFTMFASNKSSPVTDWLRDLAKLAHAECGGPGVGAIGLCVTGGFALSMAVDPILLAPVLGEPSMPPLNHAALDISPAGLACVKQRTREEGLTVIGYRFEGDTLSRGVRFETLRTELGAAFIGTELPDASGNPAGMRSQGKPPHSVFTGDLIDAPGEPTRAALDEVIAFFRKKLAGPGEPPALPEGVQQGV